MMRSTGGARKTGGEIEMMIGIVIAIETGGDITIAKMKKTADGGRRRSGEDASATTMTMTARGRRDMIGMSTDAVTAAVAATADDEHLYRMIVTPQSQISHLSRWKADVSPAQTRVDASLMPCRVKCGQKYMARSLCFLINLILSFQNTHTISMQGGCRREAVQAWDKSTRSASNRRSGNWLRLGSMQYATIIDQAST